MNLAKVMVLSCLSLPVLLLAQDRAGERLRPPNDHAKRARVVIVQDPEAIEAFNARPERIQIMVDRALTNLTGKPSVSAAWQSLVSTQDVVGLKVISTPGRHSGTRPAVVEAVVKGLLVAGLKPKQIIVWDKQLVDLRLAGFFELADKYGIRVESSVAAGFDPRKFYDTALLGQLIAGDLEFERKGEGVGRKSFVSKLVTQEMTKIINLTPLLNHNHAGVWGNLLSLALGSADNTLRFEITGERLANAVPEIYALEVVGDKVVLNIVDALICQYEGGQLGLLHYSTTLNQLRFSTDPVALDVLSLQELERQRGAKTSSITITNFMELYQNATILELGVSNPRHIQVEAAP